LACRGGHHPVDNPSVYTQDPKVKKLTEDINSHPKDAQLYFLRAELLHSKGGLDSLALKDYEKALSLDSSKGEYYSAIGDLLFEHKDITGSTKWLEKAIALNPKDPKAHLKIAKMMIYMDDYTKAFAEINTVLRQDVYNPEAYFLKGIIYKELHDTDKAISSFQTTINAVPTFHDAVLELGILYSYKKDPIALKYYDNAFKIDSTDVAPIYGKGMFYQEAKDYCNAKIMYRDCILRNQKFVDAYFSLGWIYLQQDSLDKAWRHFDLVTKMDVSNAGAYYNRGLCNELMKKIPDAIKDYKQALIFNKDYKDAQDALKRLHTK
jgi:tetratricopeptide (TPR) repeat protein